MEIPYPVTSVRKCTSSNVKALQLKHLQLSDLDANGGQLYGTRLFYHWTDDLDITKLRSWWTVYSSCKEPTLQVSGHLISKLIGVRKQSHLCI